MARANKRGSDQLYRSRSRNPARQPQPEKQRVRQIRSWILLVTLVVGALLAYRFLRGSGPGDSGTARLPCYANQNVTPFGESRTARIAQEHSIPLLAQIPMDPALARECDTGVIELFNEDWMDGALAAVESCPRRTVG